MDVMLTPRLRLTPIGPADVEDLIVLFTDPLVALWTGPWDLAEDMATRWSVDGVGKWLARSRSDTALVGRGGFTRVDLDGELVLELGWAVRDALTGRGYATEIGRAALHWAAIHHPRTPVVAFTEVHNQASLAGMRHLGMQPSGAIRRPGLVQGCSGLHPDAPFAVYRLGWDDRGS